MSNLVRAKHPNGGEFTTSEAYAKRKGLTYDAKKPTRDRFGRIVPDKPATTKGGQPRNADKATRAELEESARAAGFTDEQIASASNKADLAALIEEGSK